MTVLLVEQNIHRALGFVERAYVVENGRTVLAGTREELLNDAAFGSKFLVSTKLQLMVDRFRTYRDFQRPGCLPRNRPHARGQNRCVCLVP